MTFQKKPWYVHCPINGNVLLNMQKRDVWQSGLLHAGESFAELWTWAGSQIGWRQEVHPQVIVSVSLFCRWTVSWISNTSIFTAIRIKVKDMHRRVCPMILWLHGSRPNGIWFTSKNQMFLFNLLRSWCVCLRHGAYDNKGHVCTD